MPDLTVIIGAARSGKSRLAEQFAGASGRPVLYVATLETLDDEMEARAAAHRARRPPEWSLIEEPVEVVGSVREAGHEGLVLLDCVTLWVSNLLIRGGQDESFERRSNAILGNVAALIDWQIATGTPLIAVSNEVGGGLVPEYQLGREFRDVLGEVNQRLALAADHLYYTVAGHYIDVKAAGGRKIPRAP